MAHLNVLTGEEGKKRETNVSAISM